MFEAIETPRLILDKSRLEANTKRFLKRADEMNIALRPHLKTSKSVDVAKVATAGRSSGITVSTLKEAEHFAANEFDNILLAAGITPNKFPRVKAIMESHKTDLIVITDSVDVAHAAATFAEAENCALQVLIEIDCGEHRGGLAVDNPDLLEIARTLDQSSVARFKGVITHAGHSYGTEDENEVRAIAANERQSVLDAAQKLADINIACEIMSVGSTPTFLFAETFEGLTEVRCGVFVFFDLAQVSRGICSTDDIAVSVLASVIGHSRLGQALIIDAGAFALSKDFSANAFLPDAGYGYVCDPVSMQRLGTLSVNGVHQEHGTINIDDEAWYQRLPVGSQVRIMPNHACPTAAAHDNYLVIENGAIIAEWPRVNGW